MIRFVFAIALVVLATDVARAKDFVIDRTYVGSDGQLGLDSNGDGVRASEVQAAGRGRLGSSQLRVRLEWEVGAGPSCPVGALPIVLVSTVSQTGVETYEKGSQVFFTYTTGSGCFDLATGGSTVTLSGAVTGGTGRFAGALGTFTSGANTLPFVPFVAGDAPLLGLDGSATFTFSTP